jgi:hypothetical protein
MVRATALFFLSSTLIETELDPSLAEQMFRESLSGYSSIATPILKGERCYLRQFPTNYEELTSIAWIFAMAAGESKLGSDQPLVRSRIPVLALQSRLGGSKSWFSLAP